MKVVLLKDVPKLGHKYDVKNVSDGYAANFLMPRGLANFASSELLKKIEVEKNSLVAKRKAQNEIILEKISNLGGKFSIMARANEKGHLFAGIDKKTIVEKLSQSLGIEISPELILMEGVIKEIGDRDIEIKLGSNHVKIKLTVLSENAIKPIRPISQIKKL